MNTVYVVYSIQGTHSPLAYYGYLMGNDDITPQTIKQAVLKCANRPYPERGDVRIFNANQRDESVMTVEILDVFNDEVEAWMSRNEYRSLTHNAITGPTMFPGNIAERAAANYPDTIAKWKLRLQQRGAKTAREAWKLGMWASEIIKALPTKYNRDQVIHDLDKMSPIDFSIKYSI